MLKDRLIQLTLLYQLNYPFVNFKFQNGSLMIPLTSFTPLFPSRIPNFPTLGQIHHYEFMVGIRGIVHIC